ncbi:hypothetical protein FOZ60_017353 [Perkinsus olseni]|uniref:Uncharacterized protein n=1 Tax=Perkinsus olseni TaxID=32597 RepID=A0A7J6N0P2_PEROL|nr:hypothetical protein FOZ60_017353 [Perkinsus olseni]
MNVVHSCQALLFGKCIAIVDNVNAQRVWNNLEAEFNVGSIATDVKAATCTPSNSSDPDSTQPICAAAGAGDSPQFNPLYLPGEDLRGVFRAWRDMAQSKEFETYDDDFDSLRWLAQAQAECPHLQHRQVNPAKYQLNDAGLLHVNDRYMVSQCYSRDVVRREHESYAHCGIAQCISIISSIFYVIGRAAAVSKVLSRCKCSFIRAVRLHRSLLALLRGARRRRSWN